MEIRPSRTIFPFRGLIPVTSTRNSFRKVEMSRQLLAPTGASRVGSLGRTLGTEHCLLSGASVRGGVSAAWRAGGGRRNSAATGDGAIVGAGPAPACPLAVGVSVLGRGGRAALLYLRQMGLTHDARDELLITVRRADLRSMCLRGAPRLHEVHRAMVP